MSSSGTIACIEVGGSGIQTVLFANDELSVIRDGAHASATDMVLMAVPGLIQDGRVVAASNMGWYDVDPAMAVGLDRSAALVLNDAEAAALGEAALRDVNDLTFVGLGTGVGGAIVRDGAVIAHNLLGHQIGYSDRTCACGARGCLETVAAGWALPDPVQADQIGAISAALARAVREEPLSSTLVVVTGGLARRYPAIVSGLAALLPGHSVEPTAAPPDAKSAAAWGLARAARRLDPAAS